MNTNSLIILLIFIVSSCRNEQKDAPKIKPDIPTIDYEVVANHPHDTISFTEGLLFHEGQLYESTGASENLPQTKSLFGTVDPTTGKITTKAALDSSQYFGEGIAFLNGKVFQLTYKNKTGFIYDVKTFRKTGQFTYANAEGWGMTTDGKSLIMSDGTSSLTYLDPETQKPVKTLAVTENGYAKENLNELEFINGFIYANIFMTDAIVKIDPANGNIVGKLDLSSLAQEAKNSFSGTEATNGIAFDAASGKIYVTGKLWPKLYEIKFAY